MDVIIICTCLLNVHQIFLIYDYMASGSTTFLAIELLLSSSYIYSMLEKECYFFSGLTAVDFVTDFEEWINSGFFDEETQARFKGTELLCLHTYTF